LWAASESPLAIVYHRSTVRPDGSLAAARYFDHATGAWSTVFDATRHARRGETPLGIASPGCQAFAIPEAVAADPATAATVRFLKPDGSLGGVFYVYSHCELANIGPGVAPLPG